MCVRLLALVSCGHRRRKVVAGRRVGGQVGRWGDNTLAIDPGKNCAHNLTVKMLLWTPPGCGGVHDEVLEREWREKEGSGETENMA